MSSVNLIATILWMAAFVAVAILRAEREEY